MGIRFIRIAVVYFGIAVLLGMIMGITSVFHYATVHAHLNLLGWVSMALFGIIYLFFPAAGETGLAKVHFWMHNLGLPVFQGSLLLFLLNPTLQFLHPITIISSLVTVAGVLLYVVNILICVTVSKTSRR